MPGETTTGDLTLNQPKTEEESGFRGFSFDLDSNRADALSTSMGIAFLLTHGDKKDVYEFGDPRIREEIVLKVSKDLEVLTEAKGMLLLKEVVPSKSFPKIHHVGMIEGPSPVYYSIVERVRPLADPKLEEGKPLLQRVDEYEAYRQNHPKFGIAVDNLSLYEVFYSGDIRLLANWGVNGEGEYLFLDLDSRNIPFNPQNIREEVESINSQRIQPEEMAFILSKKTELAAQVHNLSASKEVAGASRVKETCSMILSDEWIRGYSRQAEAFKGYLGILQDGIDKVETAEAVLHTASSVILRDNFSNSTKRLACDFVIANASFIEKLARESPNNTLRQRCWRALVAVLNMAFVDREIDSRQQPAFNALNRALAHGEHTAEILKLINFLYEVKDRPMFSPVSRSHHFLAKTSSWKITF